MKTTVLAMFVLILSIASNAHALVSYSQTYTYSPPFSLNNGKNNQLTSFTFTGVTDQFVADSGSPALSLDLTGSTDFQDIIVLVGGVYVGTLNSEQPVIYFKTPEMLDDLNKAIIDNKITFDVQWDKHSSTLTSATLSGNLAPEPASALLVAAGLGLLPFLRRLRKQ